MPDARVASPSINSPVSDSSVQHPHALVRDDPGAVDAARLRFSAKRRLLSLPSLRRRSSKRSTRSDKRESRAAEEDLERPAVSQESQEVAPIHLNSTVNFADDDDRDLYEWAVAYENQRGLTMFSTPYYSSLSLLPSDPSPFTLPNVSQRRSEQPPITLDNYPLPDGNWRWVSRCWMIDMRSDAGEVQHDGFEYNWMFRNHHWRAEVGAFSAGGWVRRRRWIRLMVRPARTKRRHDDDDRSNTHTPDNLSNSSKNPSHPRSSLPPSILTGSTDLTDRWNDMNPDDVWLGDDADSDWERCYKFMKRFGRDGRKLEVWRLWLGYYHPEHKDRFTESDDKGKRREKQWTEDEGPLPSEVVALELFSKESVALAPREYVVPVLRKYGQRLLRSFVYPDSRAQFLKLLALSGLLQELNIPAGKALESTEVDFWSYASNLGQQLGVSEMAEDVPHTPPPLRPSIVAEEREDRRKQDEAKEKSRKNRFHEEQN